LPYVEAWNREYARLGLVVIGVHSPEFEFGKRAENVARGIRDHGLTYPIAIDNEFAVWRALGNALSIRVASPKSFEDDAGNPQSTD
jgi:hypothetical protein